MDELLELTTQWFVDRGLENADPKSQMIKLVEELGELAAGLARNNRELIIDSIGDSLVVLTGLSLQLNLNLKDCLQVAYDEIKDRKGKVVNGIYVKDSDLEKE